GDAAVVVIRRVVRRAGERARADVVGVTAVRRGRDLEVEAVRGRRLDGERRERAVVARYGRDRRPLGAARERAAVSGARVDAPRAAREERERVAARGEAAKDV